MSKPSADVAYFSSHGKRLNHTHASFSVLSRKPFPLLSAHDTAHNHQLPRFAKQVLLIEDIVMDGLGSSRVIALGSSKRNADNALHSSVCSLHSFRQNPDSAFHMHQQPISPCPHPSGPGTERILAGGSRKPTRPWLAEHSSQRLRSLLSVVVQRRSVTVHSERRAARTQQGHAPLSIHTNGARVHPRPPASAATCSITQDTNLPDNRLRELLFDAEQSRALARHEALDGDSTGPPHDVGDVLFRHLLCAASFSSRHLAKQGTMKKIDSVLHWRR